MSNEAELTRLFREAGRAHHRAFAHVNGDDPRWPEWYAEFLAPKLASALGRPMAISALAAELRLVDSEHRTQAPPTDWPEYYARWFLDRTRGGDA